jgi:hypothetical protein
MNQAFVQSPNRRIRTLRSIQWNQKEWVQSRELGILRFENAKGQKFIGLAPFSPPMKLLSSRGVFSAAP